MNNKIRDIIVCSLAGILIGTAFALGGETPAQALEGTLAQDGWIAENYGTEIPEDSAYFIAEQEAFLQAAGFVAELPESQWYNAVEDAYIDATEYVAEFPGNPGFLGRQAAFHAVLLQLPKTVQPVASVKGRRGR